MNDALLSRFDRPSVYSDRRWRRDLLCGTLCRMAAFLIRRFIYLVLLVIISTSVAYVLAATQLNPRSRYEGRNPPPPPEVVDAVLDELNMNNRTPLLDRFSRWAGGVI